jgi:copper ion binding protein
MTERVYRVSGMHCASCVALVEEEVGEVAGVDSVAVDLECGLATVRFDEDRVADSDIVAAIHAAGYEGEPQ